jgi:hypothetical protein
MKDKTEKKGPRNKKTQKQYVSQSEEGHKATTHIGASID